MAGWKRRLFDYDAELKRARYFHSSHDGEEHRIESVYDVSDITAANRALHAQTDERAGWKGDMHRVASIPLVIYFDLLKRGIAKDQKAMKRWLNDPENRHFRTRHGRI